MIPTYCEHIRIIPMGHDLGPAYEQLERSATEQLAHALAVGKTAAIAAWAQALLVYPDMPWLGWRGGNGRSVQIGEAPALPKHIVYPLDLALVDYVREQLWDGFPLIVFTENTGRFDEQDRLASMFGLRCPLSSGVSPSIAILRPTLPLEARVAWLEQQTREGVHILICNSALIGDLDVTYFKRIAFKGIPSSRTTLYRSARCLLRPGQDTPVETTFFIYEGSLAKRLLFCMARGAMVAGGESSVTGEYTLDAFEEKAEASMMSEIARSMIDEMGLSYAKPAQG